MQGAFAAQPMALAAEAAAGARRRQAPGEDAGAPAPAPQQGYLAAHGVEKSFAGRKVVKGASLYVRRGEAVGLLGPNGAGKTTLLRCLAGLIRPTRGSVRVMGHDLARNPSARGALGLLSHHAQVYDDLTPRENLQFAAALHDMPAPEARITRALEGVALTDRADQPVRGFSRGLLQRLAIARATLHDPPVLLLDEPFTGLDTPAADALRMRIAHERAAGRAILCVTHDPQELWDLATRVLVLVAGQVRLDAARPANLDAFRDDYAQLLAA